MTNPSFKLDDFEGPLDLLLHLIDRNKYNILDIPIASITAQYMEQIAQMDQDRLESMSDFLVMAATLLEIKARMLLPPEKDEEGQDIDPRSELVEQLLQHKMYKYLSEDLQKRQDGAETAFYRQEAIPEEVKSYREPVDLDDLLGDVTLARLHEVFLDIMRRREDRIDTAHSSFGRIEKEEVDAKEVLRNVTGSIYQKKRCTFRSLVTAKKGKMYTVVAFLTILELMRMGRVGVEQDDTFGEIVITAKDRSEWTDGYDETEEMEELLTDW